MTRFALAILVTFTVNVIAHGQSTSLFAGQAFPTGNNPKGIAAADLNGDGRADIATANSLGNSVSVLFGTGSGGLGPLTNHAAGSSARAVAAGDLNLDGRQDLVCTNLVGDSVSILLGLGGGAFGPAAPFHVRNAPRMSALGDVNGDGKLDCVAAIYEQVDRISVLLGNGLGGFGAATFVTVKLGRGLAG